MLLVFKLLSSPVQATILSRIVALRATLVSCQNNAFGVYKAVSVAFIGPTSNMWSAGG